jgi:transposase-like protein
MGHNKISVSQTAMSYSTDLRQRVVDFVRQGGSKAEAARIFQVSRGRVYAWLSLPADNLEPQKTGPKGSHKLDLQQLEEAIQANPEMTQKELAQQFGVCNSTIHYARKRLENNRKRGKPRSRPTA